MKINEIFYSLQGEGIQTGVPTIFIRFTGCNLRCKWCDTKYAYDEGEDLSIDQIIEKIKSYPSTQICVTGGEPLLQDELSTLIQRLIELKYDINLETNGSIHIGNLPFFEKLFISSCKCVIIKRCTEILTRTRGEKFLSTDFHSFLLPSVLFRLTT